MNARSTSRANVQPTSFCASARDAHLERQMLTRTRWFGLAAVLMLAGVPCQAAETSITAIVGATVIHPDRELPSAVAPNSTLIIAGRRIESIGPAGSTAVPAGGAPVGGERKRGGSRLIELHAHL